MLQVLGKIDFGMRVKSVYNPMANAEMHMLWWLEDSYNHTRAACIASLYSASELPLQTAS